ncbi:MAG: hypothetical protein WAL04_01515 [Acidimicrobiales bacterium]
MSDGLDAARGAGIGGGEGDAPDAGQGGQGGQRSNIVVRSVAAFGRFWWDFLIGDTPELFVATLVVIGLAEALRHERVLGIVVVLVAVVGCLGLSTWRGRKMKETE